MSQSIAVTLEQLAYVRTLLEAMTETEYVAEAEHMLFMERFDELVEFVKTDDESALYSGQEIMSQIFLRYPQIGHLIPRELLWFFGGDCLHFMPDEEIDLFQYLEDLQYEAESAGETFDWLLMKQHILSKQQATKS